MQPLGENSVNVPAFLGKLWKMVNDPNTDQLISWSQSGNSFVIQNQAQFWYELLPLYYKHNNMSSFVRQLNMYGFHKVSTVENGTMDADKDEIQFYHPFFQKDQPELLKNIKRKVTVSKSEGNNQNLLRHDDLAKVLTDVKQLRGRQSSVDSQLTTMKQENAVLWRELALLRQKHLKQQQIVNKLIQFLVTLVQPTASARMGVGVKRRIPLMLHEKKSKIRKTNRSANVDSGPTIHELDAEMEIPIPDSFEEEEPMVNSPLTPTTSSQKAVNSPQSSTSAAVDDASRDMWDKPDYITTELPDMDDILGDNDTDNDNLPVETLNNLQDNTSNCDEKIFLNPTTRDTLLSNLIQGNYNSTALNGKNVGGGGKKSTGKDEANNIFVENTEIQPNNDMTVATRDMRINSGTFSTNDCSRDDLDLHLESTQSELEQLKDILNGCNSFDANALLGLFNDDAPGFGLSLNPKDDSLNETGADPMVSGSELATCGSNLIDFNELFDDSIDAQDSILATAPSQLTTTSTADSSTVNTPLVAKSEPIFPTVNKQQQN